MDNTSHISHRLVGSNTARNTLTMRKLVLLYGDTVRLFPKDSIFACKTKSGLEDKSKNKYL